MSRRILLAHQQCAEPSLMAGGPRSWRGVAMRSDKTARNYPALICLAATLH